MKMPILFIGHGNPMHALHDNALTRTWKNWGETLTRPKAILCISAHHMTNGTQITQMASPKTIHDFYGFPKELFEIQYRAPGAPELAKYIAEKIDSPKIQLDDSRWGLDHGTWSVLVHMYPKADIPVLQLSLDMQKPAAFHLELGRKLKFLRDEGVLIIGSGNIVHNLGLLSWKDPNSSFDWAVEFDEWMKTCIENREFEKIASDYDKTQAGKLSVPTTDHFYPLLYILGASDNTDTLSFANPVIEMGSLSMRCVSFS